MSSVYEPESAKNIEFLHSLGKQQPVARLCKYETWALLEQLIYR